MSIGYPVKQQVKELILKGLILLALEAVIVVLPVILYMKTFQFDQKIEAWETETSFELIPNGRIFDLMLLGPSRGREFSRYKGHWFKFQEILGTDKVINLSRGGGAGVVHEKLRLQYFINKANRAKQVWYIIDPRVINSREPNENNDFGEVVFDLPIFWEMIKQGFQFNVLQKYYMNTFDYLDQYVKLEYPDLKEEALKEVDPQMAGKMNSYYYPHGIDKKSIVRYTEILKDIIRLCQKHDMKLTFIIYPEVFDSADIGMPYLREVLENLHQEYGVGYADLEDVIRDPKYFASYNYLNSEGMIYFTESYLKPLYLKNQN